jgi:hypothetical protein
MIHKNEEDLREYYSNEEKRKLEWLGVANWEMMFSDSDDNIVIETVPKWLGDKIIELIQAYNNNK